MAPRKLNLVSQRFRYMSLAIKAIISDMDGVLWRGTQALPGMQDFFQLLSERELDFVLATNNSSRTRQDYVNKLAAMGVSDIEPRHIVTSGTATVSFLKTQYGAGARIHVVGGAGLKQMLQEAGYDLVDAGAEAVVCGVDFDLTYEKARKATLLVRAGARFIGTNPDPSFPAPEGLVPGAGSIIALIEAASSQQATIIGKPERGMFDAALSQLGTRPEETLMIGDRIGTDIAGAKALGINTALVMTGVETAESLQESDVQPDLVYAGLPQLTEALSEG